MEGIELKNLEIQKLKRENQSLKKKFKNFEDLLGKHEALKISYKLGVEERTILEGEIKRKGEKQIKVIS